ncbi:glycosyltransferase [Bacillus sp. AGMB 02131]|uniref:Glycosyltransferase n=1 Tax=Peribacillus faecalis TaxID=2772559 RepID=A0A927HAJ9_9BACI|nr:glycosyltransferase [Peribacillus faecalis]MBD3107632.1 glycosyltransferase [Peribacillus faecalis]
MSTIISVIMSTYNEEIDWVRLSVESIINQTYKDIEFIIVLDNPDNYQLKELLQKYEREDKRIKLVLNKKNMGLVSSLNIALQHCTGRYIARMDADDISIQSRLELEKEYLEKHNLDFVFAGVEIIDEQGNRLYQENDRELNSNNSRKLLEKGCISKHPTWFLKKEIYDNLKGYRDVPYSEDYDFLLRCLSKDYKIGKMSEILLLYRIRSTSISRSFGLEQYLNTRCLLHLYRKEKLDDYSLLSNMTKKSRELCGIKEIQKFNLADHKFNAALTYFKNKRIFKGSFEFMRSMFTSRYFSMKISDTIRFKVSEKIIK